MVKIPHHKNAWQLKEKNSWPSENNVSIAMKIFYREWKLNFGDPEQNVFKALNKLMIEWHEPRERKILGYSMEGKMMRGRVKGTALSPTYITIRKTGYKRIASTSLIHELVHVALWNSGKILGDPDHEGKQYVGWTRKHTMFIKKLNNLLANIDI